MKISIAVPSYNYGKYLSVCLESIRCQTHEDFEVLIADGGSTDGSLQVIQQFCERDSRFSLISRQDTGQVDAVIKAFSQASGDIFCFLNADDFYLCSDAFAAAVNAFADYKAIDVVTFSGFYVSESGQHVRPVRLRYHPFDHLGNMKLRSGALQPATFWTRRVTERYPLRREFDYSFDTVFFYESFQEFSWIELPKPIAAYRWHGGNKSAVISAARTLELARFERMKFGSLSIRAAYLSLVAALLFVACRVPVMGRLAARTIRVVVNGMSYVTAYRLPSI
ncbi:MAG: glycosyltransferase [Rhizobacter sp.]